MIVCCIKLIFNTYKHNIDFFEKNLFVGHLSSKPNTLVSIWFDHVCDTDFVVYCFLWAGLVLSSWCRVQDYQTMLILAMISGDSSGIRLHLQEVLLHVVKVMMADGLIWPITMNSTGHLGY